MDTLLNDLRYALRQPSVCRWRGRAFTNDEHVPAGRDAPLAVVVSYRTWTTWTTMSGRDPNILGKTLHIAETPVTTTIVGVAAPALDFPHGPDFWLNFRVSPQDVSHSFGTTAMRYRESNTPRSVDVSVFIGPRCGRAGVRPRTNPRSTKRSSSSGRFAMT
jgi:hypothetical protein